MTGPIAAATRRIADSVSIVGGLRVSTSVAESVSPPAVVVGPPRIEWRGYGSVGGQPTTCQWNVYLVVVMNQYSIDALLALVAEVTAAIERQTPGVVIRGPPA